MVGLNHEFARELLWREYPTDQRGSYFRQFWDVSELPGRAGRSTPRRCASGCATSPSCTAGPTDIGARRPRQPRSAGRQGGRAGAGHPRRAAQEVPHRGHLRAPRRRGSAGRRRDRQERSRASSSTLTARAGGQPAATTCVKTPLYEAKVDPDIYFFGFDLTAEKARGGADRERRRGPGLVLRHQGAAGRAALRPRSAAGGRARPSTPGTTWPGPTCSTPTTPARSCASARRR